MNEMQVSLRLREYMDSPEGWGREQGREVYRRLINFVESHPGAAIFRVSLEDVRRVDISFASETVVEIARRYRPEKGFCFVDLSDADMRENWEAAAQRRNQPIMVWDGERSKVIGVEPSTGSYEALQFALKSTKTRATEYASEAGISIANASMKFKQLWEQGFLLRREDVADSGGVEFVYYRIK